MSQAAQGSLACQWQQKKIWGKTVEIWGFPSTLPITSRFWNNSSPHFLLLHWWVSELASYQLEQWMHLEVGSPTWVHLMGDFSRPLYQEREVQIFFGENPAGSPATLWLLPQPFVSFLYIWILGGGGRWVLIMSLPESHSPFPVPLGVAWLALLRTRKWYPTGALASG